MAENAERLVNKWRKRAWRFRDAYHEQFGVAQALEIQKMQLEAYGTDRTLLLQNESLRKKLLEVCRERNELQDRLRHIEGKIRCDWCGGSATALNWIKYATVCPSCLEKGRS